MLLALNSAFAPLGAIRHFIVPLFLQRPKGAVAPNGVIAYLPSKRFPNLYNVYGRKKILFRHSIVDVYQEYILSLRPHSSLLPCFFQVLSCYIKCFLAPLVANRHCTVLYKMHPSYDDSKPT